MKQFVAREHEVEPVPGLPERLPNGESILWQGRPSARLVARHVLKKRWILGYFVLLAAWAVISALYDGRPVAGIVFSVGVLAALAAVLIGMLEMFAWAVEKTTLYTVTSRRIVIRFGVAFSMTVNLPFKQLAGIAKAELPNGAGSLALELRPENRLSWLLQWPHVRSWRFARVEPSMICLADVNKVAEILALAVTQETATTSGHAQVTRDPAKAVSPDLQAAE